MQVIGAGRIGSSLAVRAEQRGVVCDVFERGVNPIEGHGPLLVATRNNDLPAVVERVSGRRDDLVFLQNGWLNDWLQDAGLEGTTRGLLYFAATARGGEIETGTTSWFTGPHAVQVAEWFRSIDLDAQALDAVAYAKVELEKLAWLCVFGPLCASHNCSVGQVIEDHSEDLAVLTAELAAFGAVLGVQLSASDLLTGLVNYSLSIPTYRASVKEWEWRNGAVLRRMKEAGVASPLQRALTASR